ncbi:hypothetical protein DL764_001598 [Monosporascus ibericus]|uniref:FAD linked oxidase N-terminal domain-containing protein n=1 Tax=Monosporascus ibericus TaxID=155417 RepID=A0A4Q4TQD8_9PEZI|nr:hypothetical protein DL764_001598 [Monosporascus ibericus]
MGQLCSGSHARENDVASALAITEATHTKFSVRSGGHVPVVGAQSNDNSVLIALTKIDIKEFNDDKSVLSVGPGNRWIDVYNFTSPYGLAVAGGRYGQVVLGNESIIETSAIWHQDLSWALKGGTANYSIVTRFDMKTYPGRGGIDDPHTELNPSIEVHPFEDEGFFRSAYLPFVNGTFSASPVSIENFTSIPNTWYDTVSHRENWVSLPIEVAGVDDNLRREQFRALALKVAPGVVDLAVDVMLRPALESGKLSEVNGSVVSVTFEHIRQMVLQAAQHSGVYAMDVDPADVILIVTNWLDAQWDELMCSYSKDAADRLEARAKELGVSYDLIYVNNAAEGQNPFAAYGKGGFCGGCRRYGRSTTQRE